MNAAMLRHHANAAGTLAGLPVSGIFSDDWQPAEELGMRVGGQRKAFGLPAASVPSGWRAAPLLITEGLGQGSYMIVERIEDGDGWNTLVLKVAE